MDILGWDATFDNIFLHAYTGVLAELHLRKYITKRYEDTNYDE